MTATFSRSSNWTSTMTATMLAIATATWMVSPILHPATKTSAIVQSLGNLQLDVVLRSTEWQTSHATGAQQKSHPPSPLLLIPLIILITLLTLIIYQIDPSFALALDLIFPLSTPTLLFGRPSWLYLLEPAPWTCAATLPPIGLR